MEMRSVYSSQVSEIGHDPATGQLVVKWQKGKISTYDGVPDELARRVMNAPSIGQALRQSIIGQYDHKYVEE